MHGSSDDFFHRRGRGRIEDVNLVFLGHLEDGRGDLGANTLSVAQFPVDLDAHREPLLTVADIWSCDKISQMSGSSTADGSQTIGNKDVVRAFFEALSASDFEAAFTLTASAGVIHLPQPRQTMQLSQWRVVYEALMASQFPEGCRYEIHELIADGDRVCARTDSFAPMRGGGVYNNRYHWIIGLVDGLIVEIYESLDTLYARETIHANGWSGRPEGAQ
jgi:ketosteroid isomerase-like protein